MIALATALSFVAVFRLPLGGSTKLCAMLPILLISLRHGPRWGFSTAFTYAVLQLLLSVGEVAAWGLTPAFFFCTLLIDYLLAYTALGVASFFGKSEAGAYAGITLAVFLRFSCHVFSGTVLFASWMPETFTSPFLYSICYNGAFLGPELVLTLLAVFCLMRVRHVRRLILLPRA